MAAQNTQGWDLIAAITQQSLNTLVASAFQQGDIPATFSEQVNLPLVGEATVSVTIGPPSIDLNPQQGQGQSGMAGVTFQIVSGSISANNFQTITIPEGTLEVVTVLSYVTAEFSGGSTERLSIDFTSPLAVFNVIIQNPTWSQTLTTVVEAALKAGLQVLLPGSLSLGSVNVPSQAAPLVPVGQADFAIQINSDPNLNTLMLLMVTSSGTAPTGPGATDFSNAPSIIPAGQQSALYISNRMLIQELIVPQLATSLQLQASAFTIQGSATTPYTATFSGDQSINAEFDPDLMNLVVSVNSSQQVQAAYVVDAHPVVNTGQTFYIEVDGDIFVSIVLSGQTITFNTTANSGTASLHASALGWTIVVAAIIASFGTLGALLGTVLAVVVPVVLTELSFSITLPTPVLAKINQGLGSFSWPAQANFPLTSIQMPGDLIFFGTPTP
jgi:hypothetical protein